MAIAIITDTDASLPDALAEELGIYQVPITIHFGDEILKSNYEINDIALIERIKQEGKLPTTAAPAPGEFAAAYQKAFENGADEVICLTVSGEVSATYKAAQTARELMPDHQITVVDTWSVSMGQGFMVLAAAKLARKGTDREAILEQVFQVRDQTYLFASLATLKYMAMSGRVGAISAEMAKMLSIMPILTIKEGKLDLLEKVRTRKKAWNRLIELTEESLAGRRIEDMFLLHVAAEEDAKQFLDLLEKRVDLGREVPITNLSPGLSVHTGPGLVGLAFISE